MTGDVADITGAVTWYDPIPGGGSDPNDGGTPPSGGTSDILSCTTNTECGPGYFCANDICYFKCSLDSNCEIQYGTYGAVFCMTGGGLVDSCSNKICSINSDCPDGELCSPDYSHCVRAETYEICDNNIDDDFDGDIDCDDEACLNAAACQEICNNNQDDDEDGDTDCADDDCDGKQGSGGTCESGEEITCDDSFDNDVDNLVDCDDVDCQWDDNCLIGEIYARVLSPANNSIFFSTVPVLFRGDAAYGQGVNKTDMQVLWRFGDGTSAQGFDVEHTYLVEDEATYIATFKSNYSNMIRKASITIHVSGDLPPFASIAKPQEGEIVLAGKSKYAWCSNKHFQSSRLTQ